MLPLDLDLGSMYKNGNADGYDQSFSGSLMDKDFSIILEIRALHCVLL